MRRILVPTAMGAREIVRTPLLVVLLFGLPAYTIGVFTIVAPDTSVRIQLDDGERAMRVPLTEALPMFTTPMAAALVGGIGGLFVVRMTADSDRRMVVAGFPIGALVAARLIILGIIDALAAAVAVAVMLFAFVPEQWLWFAVAVLLATAIYGAIGIVVGLVLDRLAGVYVILFGVMLDLFLFQNPLAEQRPAAATVLPGHFPIRLATDAALLDRVDPLAPAASVGVLAIATTVALLAIRRNATTTPS